MELTNLEFFESEKHNLICPWCGNDGLTFIDTHEYGMYFGVTCPRCKHFVHLNRRHPMSDWAGYCIDIITICCKYPPDMAVMLKEEIKNVSPVDLLDIMKKYQNVLEINEMTYKKNVNNNKEVDMVNHPTHYETGKYECIEVMIEALGREEVKGFCICNAFKYLYRCRRKNGLEDVKKAKWYIDKFIALCEEDLGNEDN